MEGPSLVIATEDLKKFNGKKVTRSTNVELKGKKFIKSFSWGKHLILQFQSSVYRIHFLMFGSYRIDDPRENRIPKLQLIIDGSQIDFYSCAIKELSENFRELYDWSTDTMSSKFSSAMAVRALSRVPEAFVCDVLMDQSIFSGVGNIIKNEVLFQLRLHPKTKVGDLSTAQIKKMVKATQKYCHQFYVWKKAFVLKKNWKIFRKKKCPECGRKVTKAVTGKLQRVSHYCLRCQSKTKKL